MRKGRLALLLVAATTACGGAAPARSTVYMTYVAGSDAVGTEIDPEPFERAALARRASADLACGEIALDTLRALGAVVRARGCGKSALYLRFTSSRAIEVLPGPAGAIVQARTIDFLELSRAEPDRSRGEASELVVLSARGASDLDCPRGEVVPFFEGRPHFRRGVAEGCGRKATYARANAPWDPPKLVAVEEARQGPEWIPWSAEDRTYRGADAVTLDVKSADPGGTFVDGICGAPCGVRVDPNRTFRARTFPGDLQATFTIPPGAAASAIADVRKAPAHPTLGATLVAAGVASLAAGVALVGTAGDSSAQKIAGYGGIGVALPLGVIGAWLLRDRLTVEVTR